MAGANSIVKSLLKELRLLSEFQRADRLGEIEREYGAGFAGVIRREFDKCDGKAVQQ